MSESTPLRSLAGKRVLLVEAPQKGASILHKNLHALGCSVDLARDSETTIRGVYLNSPDLVVIDAELDRQSGWDVLAALRADAKVRGQRCVVVRGTEDRVVFNDVDALRKPVDPVGLFDAIKRNIRPNSGTILIVDDAEDDRVLAAGLLGNMVERVIEAADGQSGYETALREKPGLIITDIEMPVWNGYQLIKAVRQNDDPTFAKTPILVITGRFVSDEEKAFIAEHTAGFVGKRGDMEGRLRRGLLQALDRS